MNFFEEHYFGPCSMSDRFFGESHHYPTYYGIQYNHSGKFYLQLDHGPRFELEGPYAFTTYPGVFFDYGNVDGPRSHNHLCCYGDRIRRYVDSGLFPMDKNHPFVKIDNPELFYRTMKRILTLVRQSYPAVPDRAILLYEDLLLQMHESVPRGTVIPPYHRDYFINLENAVRGNPEAEWNFEREAEERSLTPTYFRRIFKQLTGFPPRQFLILCRLQKAATLLSTTSESVGAIAERIGIENEFYFSRLFKQKYRISPAGYRKEAYCLLLEPSDSSQGVL